MCPAAHPAIACIHRLWHDVSEAGDEHDVSTVGSGYVFTLIAPSSLALFWWIYALIWLGVGASVAVLTRGRIGL